MKYELVKREFGVNPKRTRRCKERASFNPLRHCPGKGKKVWKSKSEDLPVMNHVFHE